ncbi:Myc-type, basic helix-loop-helix (bHLH) domain-containing protein [Cynara cardunculus var. scolymus]|uniref:Myc-type, basic helix-loop-helix (BHLH) domain-containing protein n=1 Tax=Cynara cardunculus var. scolymus TaxID=59895 RepID=A0A118K2U7_CYNCS|nr:Myc-type, basic helix-loop-helix (bHLH) domain-containing protein [Cynara cardunculus var. scolymus]
MESENFHQQHHQDHQPVLDSSCYGLSWSQNPILNSTSNDTNSRDLKQQLGSNMDFAPCHNTSSSPLVHVLGLPWNNSINVTSNPVENFMTHELRRLARIKDEFSGSESYPKFSEMISSSPTSSIEDLHLNPSSGYNNNQDLLLRTFSNGCQIKGGQLIDQFPDDTTPNNHFQNCSNRISSRGTFSQILPTINISNLNQSPAAISSDSFDMNLPALDLFGSPRLNGNFSHPYSFNPHQLGSFFKDTCLSYGLDKMHQPNHRPVICPSKISSAFNTRTSCTEAKRPASNYMDTNAPRATIPKKSKLEPRASCAPFKTDTASVLMEAIGYIKFLQNQVETLSVPYMKSTQKANRTSKQGVSVMIDENEEATKDLRSRGLCLVPLPCLSYVTDGGGGIWSGP